MGELRWGKVILGLSKTPPQTRGGVSFPKHALNGLWRIIVWALFSEDEILVFLEHRMEYELSFYGPCTFTFVFSS